MQIIINKQFKIGAIFIIATAVLIWGIMYLKGLEWFTHRKVVFAVYERVNGLVPSNPVLLNGMKVGQVKSLYFAKGNSGKIVVELYISTNYPIPKNSMARITSSDLMGSKEVEIALGKSKEIIKEGDTLQASTEATLGEEVNLQLVPLKRKAENLISSIDTVAGIVQQLLNKNTRENLIQAIEHVKDALQNLAHMTYNIDTLIGTERNHLADIISNVESISSNLRRNNEKINTILTNFSQISDSIAKARIPTTLSQIRFTIAEVDQILEKINKGEGSLGLLINDQKLYNEVTRAATDLNLLIEDIKAHPSRYIKVSVF